MSRLLNAKQVAERLGLSAPKVRQLWDQRALSYVEIPTLAVGRRIRRTDSDKLEAWIKNRDTHNAGVAGTSEQRKAS
jgi:hypothetical protein